MSVLYNIKKNSLNSNLVKNSIWGIAASFIQTAFAAIFFIILARHFPADNFAQFLIASTIYQLIASFSSMGLSQWFIREYIAELNKSLLTTKYLKMQLLLGVAFYFLNVIIGYALYDDNSIRVLIIVLGTNIIIDNFINAVKSINIAHNLQKITSYVLILDSFIKLSLGFFLFFYSFSIISLSIFLIIIRFFVLIVFIKNGSTKNLKINQLFQIAIPIKNLITIIISNWYFVVIGSISVAYWSISNIIISKILTLDDVANYEVAFRIFSISILFPIILSNNIFPKFISSININDIINLKRLYNTVHYIYSIVSLISYAFVFSFSKTIIPLIFGNKYYGAILCLPNMFLTFLIFPSVLLQANLIVAMKLEKKDMYFNVICFFVNVTCCFLGLYFYKNLSVINYSIFISFVIFNLLQNVLLIRKKFISYRQCLIFYFSIIFTVLVYPLLELHLNSFYSFFLFLSIVFISSFFYFYKFLPSSRLKKYSFL